VKVEQQENMGVTIASLEMEFMRTVGHTKWDYERNVEITKELKIKLAMACIKQYKENCKSLKDRMDTENYYYYYYGSTALCWALSAFSVS
jgi:hypothetical protein